MRVRFLDWNQNSQGTNSSPAFSNKSLHHSVMQSLEEDDSSSASSSGDDSSPEQKTEVAACRRMLRQSSLAKDVGTRAAESEPVAQDVDIPQDVRTHIQSTVPPPLEGDEKFNLIIGSDLLYEVSAAVCQVSAVPTETCMCANANAWA